MRLIAIGLLVLAVGCVSHDSGVGLRHTQEYVEWASCVPVEEFSLQDRDSGRTFGPVALTNGASLMIDSHNLVLRRTERKAAYLEALMTRAVIPVLELRKATLADTLSTLEMMTRGPMDEPARLQFSTVGLDPNKVTVDLSVENMSVFDVLTLVCDMHGLTYRVDDRGVVFVLPRDRHRK